MTGVFLLQLQHRGGCHQDGQDEGQEQYDQIRV